MLSVETWPKYEGSDKDGVKAIIDHMDFSDDVKYGKTKIFIRSPQTIFELEKERASKIPQLVLFLQRVSSQTYSIYNIDIHSFARTL